MRVVFHVISSGASGGTSRATRYIAERDKDPTREGPGDRPLFSADHEDLTYRKADRILDRFDGQPQKEDLAHLSVSFLEEDFAHLGSNEKERQERLRAVIREGMKGMADELKVEGLIWVAGIHRNTDNPHVHVVLRDQAVSERGVVERQFGLLRTSLMPHKRMIDGREMLVPGRIGERFIAALDKQQDRFLNPDQTRQQAYEFWERASRSARSYETHRSVETHSNEQPTRDDKLTRQYKTRRQSVPRAIDHRAISESWNRDPVTRETPKTDYRIALGRHLEMTMRLAFAEVWYERAVKHGDTYRFEVLDQSTGAERKISELDVHRRASARAQRLNTGDRQLRDQAYQSDLTRHRETLGYLLDARETKIGALGKDLGSLRSTVAKVQDNLRKRSDTPIQTVTPLLSRETLSELQQTAVKLNLPAKTDKLEKLRQVLAGEHQSPTRTEDELAKLVAQLNIARADLLAKDRRLENFEASVHLTPYEVHGERWSLGALDKQIARRRQDSKFVPDRAAQFDFRSLGRFNYSPRAREQASDDVEHLQFIRGEIIRQINARREPLTNERDRTRDLVGVLDEAFDREERSLKWQDKQMPEPKYEPWQMRSLEASAEVLRDPILLGDVHEWDKSVSKSETEINWEGRAVAREIISGIAVEEAKERLQNFLESKRVASLNLGDYRTGMLRDVEARSLTDYLARLLESRGQRDYRHSINLAAHEQHERLVSDLGKARAYHEATRELASEARGREPQFTDKERINLEIYAEKQIDDSIRAQYIDLTRAGDRSDELAQAISHSR